MNFSSYKDRSFSIEEKTLIDKKIAFFLNVLSKLQINSDISSKSYSFDLNNVKYSRLKILVQCNEELKKLGSISFKIESCLEFINLKKLLDEATKKLTSIKIHLNELKSGLTEGYSKYTKSYHVEAFEEILPYSQFLRHYEETFIEDEMTKDFLAFYTAEEIFNTIKLNLIIENSNVLELIKLNPDKLINLTDVLSTNPRVISLVQKEFFRSLCQDYFKITPQQGKISHSEIITPSHDLAKRINLSTKDVAIIALSLNPVNKSPYSIGEVFTHNKLPFVVSTAQETVKLDLFCQMKIKKEQAINIVLPIYFSVIKARLNI